MEKGNTKAITLSEYQKETKQKKIEKFFPTLTLVNKYKEDTRQHQQ